MHCTLVGFLGGVVLLVKNRVFLETLADGRGTACLVFWCVSLGRVILFGKTEVF